MTEPEALWLRATQSRRSQPKAVNGYAYEHVSTITLFVDVDFDPPALLPRFVSTSALSDESQELGSFGDCPLFLCTGFRRSFENTDHSIDDSRPAKYVRNRAPAD